MQACALTKPTAAAGARPTSAAGTSTCLAVPRHQAHEAAGVLLPRWHTRRAVGCWEWLRFQPHLWGQLLPGSSAPTELLAGEPSSLAVATTLPCPPLDSGALRADLGSVLHTPPGEALATLPALSGGLSPHGQGASSPQSVLCSLSSSTQPLHAPAGMPLGWEGQRGCRDCLCWSFSALPAVSQQLHTPLGLRSSLPVPEALPAC